MKTYDQFLDDKIEVAKESEFEISLDEINPAEAQIGARTRFDLMEGA